MGNLVAAFICGLLFGSGLQISGMTDPNKIFGFLDFFGTWDPSLALVMATAVVTTAIGYVLAHQRGKPVLAGKNAWPTKTQIDSSLMIGAVIFGYWVGAGWTVPGTGPRQPDQPLAEDCGIRRRCRPGHGRGFRSARPNPGACLHTSFPRRP